MTHEQLEAIRQRSIGEKTMTDIYSYIVSPDQKGQPVLMNIGRGMLMCPVNEVGAGDGGEWTCVIAGQFLKVKPDEIFLSFEEAVTAGVECWKLAVAASKKPE
jgi:hypothetical protein